MVTKLRTNFVDRPIPENGRFDSDEYNSSMDELFVDISNVGTKWNDDLFPLLDTLPQGATEDRWAGATNVPDPWTDGLDGDNIFLDVAATTLTNSGVFWDAVNLRPRTIKESEVALYSYIDSINSTLQDLITTNTSTGLTAAQWDRLGDYVRYGTTPNDPSATDYRAYTAYNRGRYQWVFTSHTDLSTPIVVTHNMGIAFPVVQVIDTTTKGGDYSGLMADENYAYEADIGITASDKFVNIEYMSSNVFHVYTSIQNGVILAVF